MLFRDLYSILRGMYHQDLFDYLDGYDCATQDYTATILFTYYALAMFGTSILVAAIYYFAINSPRLNHRWHWFMFMVSAFVINFVIGFYFTNDDLNNGSINQLMYSCDGGDGNSSSNIGINDCILFGLSNAIFAAVFFFIVSIGMKFGSRNCKYVPF